MGEGKQIEEIMDKSRRKIEFVELTRGKAKSEHWKLNQVLRKWNESTFLKYQM